jgi:hypothetical protein
MLLEVSVFELLKSVKIRNKSLTYTIFLFFIVLIFGVSSGSFLENKYQNITKNLYSVAGSSCFIDNLKVVKTNNPSLEKIFTFLKKEKGFNGMIFSYPPGSAAIYSIFNLKPPYYNAIYEISSQKSQNESIEYINKNNVSYVILDMDSATVQDGVPDFIRTPLVFKFIINNYYPIKIIDSYLILKRDNKDFFTSKLLKNTNYKNYLLDVYLYKIPYSEGLYKSSVLKKGKLIPFLSLNNLKLNSLNKFFVLIPETSSDSNHLNTVEIYTKDNNSTKVYINSCKANSPCIINLSNLPMFYRDRDIQRLKIDNRFKGKVLFYEINESDKLW